MKISSIIRINPDTINGLTYMKRFSIVVIALALLATIVPATAAPKAQNEWSTTHKIVYVGLTPKDQPNFWTENLVDTTTATSDGEMLSFAKESVKNAITFWKQNSRGKMKFTTSKFFIGKPCPIKMMM